MSSRASPNRARLTEVLTTTQAGADTKAGLTEHGSRVAQFATSGRSVSFVRWSPTVIGGEYGVFRKAGRAAPGAARSARSPANLESRSVLVVGQRPEMRGTGGATLAPFARPHSPARSWKRDATSDAVAVGSAGGAWAARRSRLAWFPPAAASNRVEARLALAPPTPPGMRVRTGRFAQHSRKRR